MSRRIDPKDVAALTGAVRELEAQSCAEVVVEVRARSGSYAHADARFAVLLAFAALFVLLFSPWRFGAEWVAIDVAIVFAAGLLIARRSDTLRRWMTSRRERDVAVRTNAAATFFERGVANTGLESGVLLYLSLLERRIEIIADRGILVAVPPLSWNEAIAVARATRGQSAAALLGVLTALQPLLASHLPQREGDRDELANTPLFAEE